MAGVGSRHLHEAIAAEFSENEDMPSDSHPEEWARISGRRGRRIEAVVPLQGRDGRPGDSERPAHDQLIGEGA